ncbi:neural cell adhesion molecule L1-like protein isoform X3 [Paramormyrops kingsleyae]|uniref:Neural cell adhesion molecule L1-like protein n=1 Tax=Paramormyrops kingsleyae TaxID=1676925 RepID=A0A3B3QBK7_9TELE|nr:neural cell adhesion molecule L1-like protein isoform X4 [Paramormyrops kingsleyae]
MASPWSCGVSVLLGLISRLSIFHPACGLDIPLDVEQLPSLTVQSPSSVIAFPFDERYPMKCEARGNPEPEYRWTKNGQEFDPNQDPRLIKEEDSGSFLIPNSGNVTEYQGTYRCYASNRLGTAISEEIEFIVPNVPKFPKEKINPIVVDEGQPIILECNPPKGIPPLQIYWMTLGLQHIEQDERVSMGLNGNLYFSNALEKDSRRDYCCFAAFPRIRTIVQKTAMSVIVRNTTSISGSESGTRANALMERKPSLLVPSGGQTEVRLVKEQELELECIAEGFPTPKIEWTKMGSVLPDRAKVESHGKLLKISRVHEADSGKYTCKAKNSIGEVVHKFHVTVEEPPRWTEKPESLISMIGADVFIKCAAAGLPQPTITWKVNGLAPSDVPVSKRKVSYDTISLHNVQPGDSAVYQCEASNRHGTLLANANILVMNLLPMILTGDSQEYAAVVGRNVMLHCKVFSSPPATISWVKDDTAKPVDGERFFVHENGSLEINYVTKEDNGQYTCFATNMEGKSAITANLDIKDPTRIVDPPQDLRILRGTTAQFTCQADYDKSLRGDLEISWEKDDMELDFNLTESMGYFADDGILQIANVSHKDQGMYTCRARTSLDQDIASAHLIVLDVPDTPTDLVLFEHKDRSVRLKWVPGDDHNSSTTEFIVEYEESQWEPEKWKEMVQVAGNQTSALLKLHGHVDYRFRVAGMNAVGRGEFSEPTRRYKTPPAAPDRNPENIKIEGHLPDEMDIKWEPLLPIEHNGPGLDYKVSFRRKNAEEKWKEFVVKRHSFIVKNTPTFVPYEIKIQAKNHQGWGPEPKVVIGYSGEDFPSAAPEDVAIDVLNNTLIKVTWAHVSQDKLNGHLGGYRVNWWRFRSLLDSQRGQGEKHSLTFPGDRNHAIIPGLRPFSEYSLIVVAFNGRGNGPGSHSVTFKTPEGVPEQIPILRATNAQRNSITLVWAPPLEANGVLTGYFLEYQLINDTEDLGKLQSINISSPDTNKWVLENLEPVSRYKFYLRGCSRVGCGPAVSEESTTALEAIPTLLNISSHVTDNFAKISWIPASEHKDAEFYVAYKNNREGNWKISEAVNTSRNFHIIQGLEPGTVYTVRLLTKNWVDNSSIFEDVIKTRGKGLASIHGGISTQSWFIGLMCAVAFLTLTVLIACFINRNKGGKYSVKEKEDLHPDVESQGMNDDTFCEYSDNDEKPLKGSLRSLDGDIKATDSGDSLVDYGDEDGQFNEDGSFIGEYAGRKARESMEVKGTAPISA